MKSNGLVYKPKKYGRSYVYEFRGERWSLYTNLTPEQLERRPAVWGQNVTRDNQTVYFPTDAHLMAWLDRVGTRL